VRGKKLVHSELAKSTTASQYCSLQSYQGEIWDAVSTYHVRLQVSTKFSSQMLLQRHFRGIQGEGRVEVHHMIQERAVEQQSANYFSQIILYIDSHLGLANPLWACRSLSCRVLSACSLACLSARNSFTLFTFDSFSWRLFFLLFLCL